MSIAVTPPSTVMMSPYYMTLVSHGGFCCGIKTIFGFETTDPKKTYQNALKSGRMITDSGEKFPYPYGAEGRVIWPSIRPKECSLDRFISFIRHIQCNWPGQLIECAVIASEGKKAGRDTQESAWREYFEAIGFRRVTTWVNSNTRNTLAVWHLDTRGEGVPQNEKQWNVLREKFGLEVVKPKATPKKSDPFAALSEAFAADIEIPVAALAEAVIADETI